MTTVKPRRTLLYCGLLHCVTDVSIDKRCTRCRIVSSCQHRTPCKPIQTPLLMLKVLASRDDLMHCSIAGAATHRQYTWLLRHRQLRNCETMSLAYTLSKWIGCDPSLGSDSSSTSSRVRLNRQILSIMMCGEIRLAICIASKRQPNGS